MVLNIGEDLLVLEVENFKRTIDEEVLVLLSDFQSLLPEVEQGVWIVDLRRSIDFLVAVVDSHPRFSGRETTVWRVIPLNWGSSIVSSDQVDVLQQPPNALITMGFLVRLDVVDRIDVKVVLDRVVRGDIDHTEFLTLVDEQSTS